MPPKTDKVSFSKVWVNASVGVIMAMCGWALTMLVDVHDKVITHEARLNAKDEKDKEQDQRITDNTMRFFTRPQDIEIKANTKYNRR